MKLLFPLCLCLICCFEKVLGGGSDVLVNVCGWFVTIFSLVFSFSGSIRRNKVENMTPLFGFILFWLNRKVYRAFVLDLMHSTSHSPPLHPRAQRFKGEGRLQFCELNTFPTLLPGITSHKKTRLRELWRPKVIK